MQQRNLIVFFVLTLAILVGWQYLQQWMRPPRPRPKPAVVDQPVHDFTRVSAAAASSMSGLDTACRVATEVALAIKPAPTPKETIVKLPDPILWSNLPSNLQGVAAGTLVAPGLGGACRLVTEAALANWTSAPRPRPVAHRIEPVRMGDERFNLAVMLTPRGGGVQSVALNEFEQADRLGLPVTNTDDRRLHLVPRDIRAPSNLFYHYANPTENHPDHPEAELGEVEWKLQSSANGPNDDVHRVVFTYYLPQQEVTVTKTYTLKPDDYHIGLTIQIERLGSGPLPFRYQLTGAHGLPIEGEWYTTVYRNALIAWEDAKGTAWRDLQLAQKIGFQAGGRDVPRPEDKFIRYAGVVTQYFASVIVVDDQQEKNTKPNFIAWARPTLEREHPKKQFLSDITVRVVSEPLDLKPGVPVVHKYLLYNGPVKVRLLGQLTGKKQVPAALVDRYENTLHLRTLTDYPSVPAFSWWSDLLVACTNVMHALLWLIHTYVMPWSYGLSIILLTVVVRGLMFPLSRKQALASVRMQEKMQKLTPELKKLEEKYKKDPKLSKDPWALHQAKAELQKQHGVHAGMFSTCWLMFVQLPIFLGLYYALQENILFRLQPFLWIRNLAAPDMLFKWGENISVISSPDNLGGFLYLGPFFNLLPIIWAALIFIQQSVMTPPPADEQQAAMQRTMKYMMLVFFLFFYKVPAGLCIYWVGSILWSLGERKFLPKKRLAGAQTPPGASVPVVNGPPPRPKTRPSKNRKENGDGPLRKVSDWWAEVLKQAKKK
jgi:YidC/Oxa1 family membrane protein insertase